MLTGEHFRLWFWHKHQGLAVCVPAKCGGTSFYRWAFAVPDRVEDRHVRSYAVSTARARGEGPLYSWEVQHYFSDARKVLAVRNPVARFASLWRDKCRDGDPGYPVLLGAKPGDLLERVQAHPFGDPHWVPQFSYLVPSVEVVDYRRLGETLGYDVRARVTETRDDDPDFSQIGGWLREGVYAPDFDLWESANR